MSEKKLAKRITLGSGKLYVKLYGGGAIPEHEEIETEENLLGLIKNGATLKYTPTFKVTHDDLRIINKKALTNEEVILSSGIMTWYGDTLKRICTTAEVSEDNSKKTRTVKIGGTSRYKNEKYVIRFLHNSPEYGDIRITIVGSNEAGFEFSFNPENETVINLEFRAEPHDGDGTLVIYEEKDEGIQPLARENTKGNTKKIEDKEE